jgi:hypothetical protein
LMRAPVVFTVIALGIFIPGAEASAAQSAKSTSTAAQQNLVARQQGRVNAQNTASRPAAKTSAVLGGHAAQHSAPSRGRLTPYASNAGATPGSSGNKPHPGFAAPQIGGPARYDGKRGAVIGGVPTRKR